MAAAARCFRLVVIALCISSPARAAWRGTWHTSPQQAGDENPWELENVTFRDYLQASAGGPRARLHFSNRYGKETLHLGRASVGLRDAQDPSRCRSLKPVTFAGSVGASVPAGAEITSDAVELAIRERAPLCVSFYLPGKTKLRTLHGTSLATDSLLAGDQTLAPAAKPLQTVESRFFLTGVDTEGAAGPVIGFLGDSITDGQGSTPDANHRWPDFLGARLAETGVHAAILNAGISANRLLRDAPDKQLPYTLGENALARFDRELLAQPQLTHAFVLIGINDIGHPGHRAPLDETVTAEDLIRGYQQLIAKAHAKGVKIYGGTLTPFQGVIYEGFYTAEKEKVRQAVNEWIRTSHAFDGVVDFDLTLRDPQAPLKLLEKYDSGDHIHPSDAGYRAMAEAVSLKAF